MFSFARSCLFSLLVFSIFGCATFVKRDSLDDPGATLEVGNSIYLLSGNLKNTYKPKYQPKPDNISIERMEDEYWIAFAIPKTAFEKFADSVEDSLYITGFKNEAEDPKVGHSFLAHIALEPGDYTLRFINSASESFLISGTFRTPIHHVINVSSPGIYYLGRINAVVRKREGKEFKAGRSVPLVDQSTVGASGGTFDVEILDKWEEDEPLFLKQFPALQGAKIIKALLPSFDRSRAQQYWEKHSL